MQLTNTPRVIPVKQDISSFLQLNQWLDACTDSEREMTLEI